MATRFYLPSTGAAEVTPANDSWDKTTGAGAARKAVTARISSAMATVTNTKDSTTLHCSLIRQYVTGPLAAQTISGTVKGQMRCIESNGNFAACVAVSIRACSEDGGTIRSPALLAISNSDLYTSGTVHEMATSLTNRSLEDSAENKSLSLTSCTLSEGDRLVIELGFRSSDTSTIRTGGISFGDDHATTDLPEDQVATAANNPWIEFSQTINFPATTGSGSAAFSPFAASGSGSETFSGSGSAAFSPQAQSGSGSETFSGTGSAALSPLAASGSGTVEAPSFTGSGAAAFSPFAASGSGTQTFSGAGTAAFASFAATGAGTVEAPAGDITGTGSAAFSPFAASGSGTETFAGTGAAAVQSFAASGSGSLNFAGSASAAFSRFAASGTASESFTGSGAAAFSPFAASGAGQNVFGGPFTGTGTAAFSPFAASGTGVLEVAADELLIFEGIMVPSADGTLQLRIANASGSTIVILEGSTGELRDLGT